MHDLSLPKFWSLLRNETATSSTFPTPARRSLICCPLYNFVSVIIYFVQVAAKMLNTERFYAKVHKK